MDETVLDRAETTPWRTAGPHSDGSDTVVDARGIIVCALMPHAAHYAPQIVTAVNAHAALVAALREILTHKPGTPGHPSHEDCFAQIEAIANAAIEGAGR